MSAYLEQGLLEAQPLRGGRPRRRGRAGPAGCGAGPGHPAGPQDRGVRRARGRPRVHRHLRPGRSRLRELLALPGAHRPPGRRPGGAGREPLRHRSKRAKAQAQASRLGAPRRRTCGSLVVASRYRHHPWGSQTRTWPGSGRHRHRGAHRRARCARSGRAGAGSASARSTARRRLRSASTPKRASTTASGARPRATPSASCGPSSTSTSSTPSAGWPTRRVITIREDADAGRASQRRKLFLDAMEQATEWYHQRLLTGTDAGQARDYLRSRGYDGDGGPPVPAGMGARRLGRTVPGPRNCPSEVAVGAGLGFVNRRGRLQDAFRARVLFPICDPSGQPVALGGRVLPGSCRPGQVQELPGDRPSTPSARRSTASTGPSRTSSPVTRWWCARATPT